MDIDLALLIAMFVCLGIMATTAVTDGLLFRYKKAPGRGYAQVAKPGVSKRLINIYSNLELVGFIGFVICVLVIAFRTN